MEDLNPVIYEGAPLQDRALAAKPVPAVPEIVAGKVGLETILQPLPSYQQGDAIREAASAPPAPIDTVVAASMDDWWTTSLYRSFTDPKFEPDGTKPSDLLKKHPVQPETDAEMRYYTENYTSVDSGLFMLDRIQTMRDGNKAKASRPITAAVIAALDPALIGTTMITGGLSTVAKVGSAAAKIAVEGAQIGTLAVMTRSTRPTEDTEMLNLLGAFAAPLVGFKGVKKVVQGGKIVEVPVPHQLDPDFPTAELKSIIKNEKVVAQEVEIGAHAESEWGQITLTPSTKEPGKFQLTHWSDEVPVEDHQFDNIADAKQAFHDAVFDDEATITHETWGGSEQATWNSKINPDTIEGEVMLEDAGLNTPGPRHTALAPGVTHTPEVAAQHVDAIIKREARTWLQKVGSVLEWNVHKSMRNFGETGSKIADLLFDNNGNLKLTSVEAHTRGIQMQLKTKMGKFDNQLRAALAEDGYGFIKQLSNPKAAETQANIERQVSLEMLRRDQLGRQGRSITHEGIPTRIKDMADTLDGVAKASLEEMQAAGVLGSEELKHQSGWFSRKWDSMKVQQSIDKIMTFGHDAKKAKAMLVETVARSMADANPEFSWEIAHDIAQATIDRSLRKGAFEDSALNMGVGMENTTRIRDILKGEGMDPKRIQRIMDVVVGKVDEQGKASFLKHRIDMDYTANLELGGDSINVTDLFDHGIKDIFDRYIDKTAAESGFAKKGFKSPSDIARLKAEGIESLKGDVQKQREFIDLFDGTIETMHGRPPAGGDLGLAMRNMGAFSRLTSLTSSGFWQLTEYAQAMQQYGALKTIKYAIQELPVFREALETAATDKMFSTHLKDILSYGAENDLRLQPFVRRFADGMTMPANATLSGRLQHSTQITPYLNGMKYIHSHQARTTANLIIDCINRAAKGDAKMVKQLEKYGVTPEHMTALKSDVELHGMNVHKWGDTNWHNVRPAFLKMMDESVLHARLGDTPAFALLNPVGKFMFTYKGFMLTAHNKLLAGVTQRDGLSAIGMVMAYQYPVAALAVQAQATVNNKKKLSPKELAGLTMGQLGSAGMFAEVAGIVSGQKNMFGSTGTIPIDRAYKLVGGLTKGDPSRTAHDVFQMFPALAILPPARAFEGWANPQSK